MKNDLINNSNFRNQIAYWIDIPGGNKEISNRSEFDLLNGFFSDNVYVQHEQVLKKIIKNKVPNLILELPHYSGKTTACFLTSFMIAYSQGKNSLIIYPDIECCKAAEKFIKEQLEIRLYHHLNIVEVITEVSPLNRIDRYSPKIYLTYIGGLHFNILPNLNLENFWSQVNLICFEDIELYQSIYGINSAYVLRRLRAKLMRFNAHYQILVTICPIHNRTELVEKVSGIPAQDFQEIINTNNAYQPSRQIIQWFPGSEYTEEIKRTNYYTELSHLIDTILKTKKNVAVIWDKYLITPDDIANIGLAVGAPNSSISQLFVGNTATEIRQKMLSDSDFDWQNIDIILVVGATKQISHYLYELNHCGSDNHQIIFYDHVYPSLSWRSLKIIYDQKGVFAKADQQYPLKMSISDLEIIRHHRLFLKEEYPEISTKDLQIIFPAVEETEDEQPLSRYIYLNKDVQFLPRKSRKEQDLFFSGGQDVVQLILSESSQIVGFLPLWKARAYLYPSARFDFSGQHYRVSSINYSERKAYLQALNEVKIKTSRLTAVNFTPEKIDSQYGFGEGIDIEFQTGEVSCDVLGIRSTVDFEIFDENIYPVGTVTFDKVQLKSVLISINPRYVFPETFFNRETETQEGFRQYIWQVRNLLHVLVHILIESARTFVHLYPQEIDVQIITENDENTGEPVTGIRIIDITNQNDHFLNLFREGSIRQIFEHAEEILLKCPCYGGCHNCTSLNTCNLSHDELTIDKLKVLQIVCRILGRSDDEIKKFVRWKNNIEQLDTVQSGILRNDTDKLASMVEFSWKIVDYRGFLGKFTRYSIRFASDEELNSGYLLDSRAVTNSIKKEIVVRPGLPEYLLYYFIFREIFHNYLFEEQYLHQSLNYFNWNNVDDPNNIPYIGRLVYDGFAVWFSIRMLEYFNSNFISEVLQNLNQNSAKSGTKTAFKIEKEKGYLSVIRSLQRGFSLKDYDQVYTPYIHGQKDSYLESKNSNGKVPDRLVCLRQKNELGNIQRLSYILTTLDFGQGFTFTDAQKSIKNYKKDIKHISWNDIQDTALLSKERYINNQNIQSKLIDILGSAPSEENILVCERCETPCNIFNACMLNASVKNFIDLLLYLYPKPKKKR